MLFKFSKKIFKLRRLHRASAEDFPQLSLSCEVTEVSMLFQKKSSQVTNLQKLRRLHRASVEDFPQWSLSCKVTEVSMLFQIFKKNLQVTKLQKLRRLHRASAEDFPQLSLSCEVTEVSMFFKIKKKKSSQVTKLQRLRPELWSNPSIYLATTVENT